MDDIRLMRAPVGTQRRMATFVLTRRYLFKTAAILAVLGVFLAVPGTRTGATVPPSVTIDQAAGQTDPTSTLPINFTVVFSEAVTGLTGAEVTLSGTAGATTAVVSLGPTTYNVAVSGMTGWRTQNTTRVAAGWTQDVTIL